MKALLLGFILFTAFSASILAQAAGNDVEVRKDRFTGVTTVSLKPQILTKTAEYEIDLSKLQAEFGGKNIYGRIGEGSVYLEVMAKPKKAMSFGDLQLHFLVDGKPVDTGHTTSDLDPLDPSGYSHQFFIGIPFSTFKQIAIGKQVELRVGTIELTLSQTILGKFKDVIEVAPVSAK
ncbi:MAG TPA: hypothetical protein VFC63_22925 [Blastocatellia bacterium]|nr:hypothetical protein [Blastocatellia bacterium]